jgi:hypothetical protein
MAALSPAQANAVSLWLVIFLAVLLALSLAAVITSPPQADSPPRRAMPGLTSPGMLQSRPRPRCRAASRASPGLPTRPLPTPVTRPVPRA